MKNVKIWIKQFGIWLIQWYHPGSHSMEREENSWQETKKDFIVPDYSFKKRRIPSRKG
ncbi:MAG: hypothetical protein N2V77_01655 [Canidatus Methanoxibalbensis ujae]|nr:hypothetical protein [Candidatus Methanoxibalbensis ujae]